MARRVSTRKFESPEVQGPDSYVKFKVPKFADASEYRSKMVIAVGTFNDGRSTAKTRAKSLVQVQELMIDYGRQYFHSWDWVDDEEKPLKPFNEMEDPGKELTEPELDFMIECFRKSLNMLTEEERTKAQENGQDTNFPDSD